MQLIFSKGSLFSVRNVLCIVGVCLLSSIRAEAQPIVKTEVLLQTTSSWDGVKYKHYPPVNSKKPLQLSVLKITIPANAALAWHTHPMPNTVYVLSGKLTVEKKGTNKKIVLEQGQVLPEMVNQLHRGIAGKDPVVLIAFYAGSKGMPLSKPVKQ